MNEIKNSSEGVDLIESYQREGFVVVRDCIDKEICRELVQYFQRDIKSSKDYYYRQTATGLAERHQFNKFGLMMNSILNPHDLNSESNSQFLNVIFKIYGNKKLGSFFRSAYKVDPIFVQTMYFEGNPATWAHQDVYYLDSTHPMGLMAVWIALEDIDKCAGRFFVCPGSHKLALPKNQGENNFSYNHEQYKEYVKSIIQENSMDILSPELKAGDVLFWSSRTIHGSHVTEDESRSRHSLTAHLIPRGSDLVAFQSIKRRLIISRHEGQDFHHPKSLDLRKNRLILKAESLAPRTFKFIKKIMIRIHTR